MRKRFFLKRRSVALVLAGAMAFSSIQLPSIADELSTETVTEAPTIEVPVVETPVTEAPVTEVPVPETQTTEAPTPETQASETVAETQAETTPVTEAPATEVPVETEAAPASEASVQEETEAPVLETETFAAETEEETESLPANILTYVNTVVEKNKDPYLDIELTGKNDFPYNSSAFIEILKDAELDAVYEYLLEDFSDKDIKMVLPLQIEVLNEKGKEQKDLGEVNVKIHYDDIESLKNSELYHYKNDQTWEKLNFDLYKETDDEMAYVEFTTKSFSPFLFVEIDDKETKVQTEIQTEIQTEATAETEMEAESESEPEIQTELQTEIETEPETEIQTETEIQSETELETEVQTDTEFETESETEAQTEAETETSNAKRNNFDYGIMMADVTPIQIDSFTVGFASGASKMEDGSWVWTAENKASGHLFMYRASYTISGTFTTGAKAFVLEVPLHILKDRDGNWADNFECPYVMPSELDGSTTSDFVYEIDEENNKAIIYNYSDVSSGSAGYVEFGYETSKSTLDYVDMGLSTDVPATLTATNEDGSDTATATADPVCINTHATISYTQKKAPTYYSSWQNKWGTKPDDADDYVYLSWPIRTYVNENTSSYTFLLEDDFSDLGGSVIGYKFSGQGTYSKINYVTNVRDYGDRYDYVLTRHSREEVDKILAEEDRYEVTNYITVTVRPTDQVDPDTKASSSRSWWYEIPKYYKPTGHFMAWKRGVYGKNDTYVDDSEDISSYQLEEFQEGEIDSLDNLRYWTAMEGYPYPWTLGEGATGTVEDAKNGLYGQVDVDWEFTDYELCLDHSSTLLSDEDYDFTSLRWSPKMYTAVFSKDDLAFHSTAISSFEDDDIITIWGRVSGEWVKMADYSMKTKSYSNINTAYVSSAENTYIYFNKGVKGFRYTFSNAYYYTRIDTYPSVSLYRTDSVLAQIGKETGKKKVSLTNTDHMKVSQNGGTIMTWEESGTDYIKRVEKESEIRKDVIKTSNYKLKKIFEVTWRVIAREKYVDDNGINYIYQDGGTFYDLIPTGTDLDKSSIIVYASGNVLPDTSYSVDVISNYQNSGRTMVVVKIDEPTNTSYQLQYKTIYTYDSIHDFGKNLLNSVAYETGNDKIAEGCADNGGAITDKDLMKDLDPDTDAVKFIYSESRYNVNIPTAASTGLMKQVKAEHDSTYSYSSTVYNGETYSYHVRFANDFASASKDIIIYDSLENFFQNASETEEAIKSDWKGTLIGIDTGNMTDKGIKTVIYLSKTDDINLYNHHDLDETVNGEKVWMEYSEFVSAYGLDEAHAIAVDARKTIGGKSFVLAEGESITFTIYMTAPATDTTSVEDPVTYNNIYMERTVLPSSTETDGESQFYHQDYTQLRFRTVGNVKLKKVDSTDETKSVSNAVYKLRGTSKYGTEYNMEKTTNSSGLFSFNDVERGTYELLEVSCTNDWQLDTNVYTVIIDEYGNTMIDGMDLSDDTFLAKDEPRVHANLTFYKKDSISGSRLNGATFRLSGTSDYGNDILMYGTSEGGTELVPTGKVYFENIELGTYELFESETVDGYIKSTTVYTVRVDDRGVAVIYNGDDEVTKTNGKYEIANEPYHTVRFLKSSSYGTNIYLEGAEFSLTGVSDYGTNVDMTAVSGKAEDGGLVVFEGLEPGTYELKETKAPAEHDLNDAVYTVIVHADGTFEIPGLSKVKFGSSNDAVDSQSEDSAENVANDSIEDTTDGSEEKTMNAPTAETEPEAADVDEPETELVSDENVTE